MIKGQQKINMVKLNLNPGNKSGKTWDGFNLSQERTQELQAQTNELLHKELTSSGESINCINVIQDVSKICNTVEELAMSLWHLGVNMGRIL